MEKIVISEEDLVMEQITYSTMFELPNINILSTVIGLCFLVGVGYLLYKILMMEP